MRKLRQTFLFSSISVALGFGHTSFPRGCSLGLARSNHALAIPPLHSRNTLLMVIKSSDLDDESEISNGGDSSLQGVNRFSIMGGGMLRGGGDEKNDDADTQEKDEVGFIKNISKRLTFRRESEDANGYQVDDDKKKRKTSGGFLRMMGMRREKNTAEQLALLQKDQELNRKKKALIAEQRKRDEQREREIKMEEQRIAKELKRLEVALDREEAKKRKEQAKLEAEKQKELAKSEAESERREQKRLKQAMKKAAVEEKKASRKSTQSVAGKFLTNVWNTTVSTFGRDEEWVPLIKKTRIEPGEFIPLQIKGLDLLVVASRDGEVHCLANSCSHMGTPLETGRLVSRPKEDANGNEIFSKTDPTKPQCEDCIVCPLHQTAFSLETGEVRGEWCPYPPVIGPAMGKVKKTSPVATFDVRTRGKFIEVRINSPLN